jgi:hypothetical protein
MIPYIRKKVNEITILFKIMHNSNFENKKLGLIANKMDNLQGKTKKMF